jgi:hypothetical protein
VGFKSNEKGERRIEALLEPIREARQEWERFASLPGTRVVWKRKAKNQYELIVNDTCMATVQLGLFGGVKTLSIDVDERRVDYECRRLWRRWKAGGVSKLVEVTTGRQAFITTGTHLDHHTDGTIELPGHGTFGFPVHGTSPSNAVMSAVDESGKSQLHYRIGDPKLAVKTWQRLDSVEVVIAPECQVRMESVLLLIAASSSWLRTYFEQGGSGG